MSFNLKMEPLKNQITVHGIDPAESKKFIEWNVDMNVVLSSSKRFKFIQRIRNLMVFFLMIAFAAVFSHLKGEIRALQVQVIFVPP